MAITITMGANIKNTVKGEFCSTNNRGSRVISNAAAENISTSTKQL